MNPVLTLFWPAPFGVRYGRQAFDHIVGHRVPFDDGEAIVQAVRISDDGSSAELDLEVPHLPDILARLI